MADWEGPSLDRLVGRADTLAGSWAARARLSTTLGQERAILRLFGVHGLDASGQPLAGQVVDRYMGSGRRRLASGIALPFAMALLEYDLGPQELALDVASGAIDLGMEAELLLESDRRATAEQEAGRLAEAAIDRIDANRTARRELIALIGDTPRPWVGGSLSETAVDAALREAAALVGASADLVRVRVPVGRELADRLQSAGVELGSKQARAISDPTPIGSQRGLAQLREALDEAAAERRGYVRLTTASPALSAPEQAVVAAFERVDIVEADPVGEIVEQGVDPDRAIADHTFAHWLVQRSGAQLLVGAGPLVVAPDLARGFPSDPATRCGRALAMQLLAVMLARRSGLADEQVIVDSLPSWIWDEPNPTVQAIAAVAVRRAALPGHHLAFREPEQAGHETSVLWPLVLAASLPFATIGESRAVGSALVLRRYSAEMRDRVLAGHGSARASAEVAAATEPPALRGAARDHVQAIVRAAETTLQRLADQGWTAVLGEPFGRSDRTRLGADAVVERSESFDPFDRGVGVTAGR